MARLHLKNLVKAYGSVEIIHGIDLEIEHGEFAVFVGPSGCGKSTLLRLIAGLEDISSGELLIDGECVNDVPAARRGLAMVFQSYALYPHMTVYENLAFGLENIGTRREVIDKKVMEVAETLQIGQLLRRKPTALSGGQRQRVAIGRAIVREPKIFLFDEPLSNLDAELRVQMRAEISQLHRQLGNTMIYVTHDQVEAMTMADKIVVLRGGHVEQVGTPLDLYNRPSNQFVAGFIGSPKMNFVEGAIAAIDDNGVDITLRGDNAPNIRAGVDGSGCHKDEPVILGIRPEHVVDNPDLGNAVTLSIHHAEQLGSETYLFGRMATGQPLVIRSPGQSMTSIGDTIDISIPEANCHVFRQDDQQQALPRVNA